MKKKVSIVFSQYRKLLDLPDVRLGFMYSFITYFECTMQLLNFLREDFPSLSEMVKPVLLRQLCSCTYQSPKDELFR